MRSEPHALQPSFIVSKRAERADRPDFLGSAWICPAHGSLLRYAPCRQVRGFQPLTVVAFAVCVRDAIHPPVCEHTAYVFHPVHAWLIAARKKPAITRSPVLKSDRRGSNSRPPPWQGGVLPTVLLSQLLNCDESCHQSDRRGSNSRPPPWQGGVLPTVLLSHLLPLSRWT